MRPVPALLPFLSFAILAAQFRRRKLGWRRSLVFASIPWALFLAFLTEALSDVHRLTRTAAAVGWVGFALVCLVCMRQGKRGTETERAADPGAAVPRLGRSDRVLLLWTAAIVFLVGLTAIVSAPNTWDAMEYHLPRVVMWMNNRGVQFFPTLDRQQLDMPPFAEYIMLHLDLLYGGDRLVGLAQWLSYAGFILVASLIAEELGGDGRAQMLAGVLSATLPSAILGASGTKNDCVLAYWIACSVYLLLLWRRRRDWPVTLAIGGVLGLAVFTKGTAYTFLPCMAAACALMWNGAARKRFALRLPAIAAMAILVCLPLWVRNDRYCGSILGLPYFDGRGSVEGRMFRNDHITPAQTAANVARSLALHIGVPSERVNAVSTRAISRFIEALGLDPNDPGQLVASQTGRFRPFAVGFHPRNEVLSGDPLHLFLFLFAAVLCLVDRPRIERAIVYFGLGVAGGFVLYCTVLRWSPWNARYQVPMFVLGAVFTALVLVRTLPRAAVTAIAGIAILLGLPAALMNETRPLLTKAGLRGSILTLPRDETYFLDEHQDVAASYIAAAQNARRGSCRSIGLDAGRFHFDYPMLALLAEDGAPRKLRYVGVENSTIQYAPAGERRVCTVVCLGCKDAAEKWKQYAVPGGVAETFGWIVVFHEPPAGISAAGEVHSLARQHIQHIKCPQREHDSPQGE